jgi:2-oxoglutarate ferredoxin oxidoreductase subunit delta
MHYQHHIDIERCKGCGLCVSVCPKGVLAMSVELNTKGYYPAYQEHPENCIHCTMCCLICPDAAIRITETPEAVSI